jgi:hypothetical protein
MQDNAEFREGIRNHNYVSPTHFSNTALYGNNREETSAPKNQGISVIISTLKCNKVWREGIPVM